MVSRSAVVSARLSIPQGDVVERVISASDISESSLIKSALCEYISNHHPEMYEDWNGVK